MQLQRPCRCIASSLESTMLTTLLQQEDMTTPSERSRAVIQARAFLETLARSAAASQSVRQEARDLLRHYPSFIHLELSASACSAIWGNPNDPVIANGAEMPSSDSAVVIKDEPSD